MAFSSGTFSRLYSWVDDRDNGVKIRADRMDAEFDGIATGLSTAILKDGTQTITADIPWGGNKITGLGDPTSAQDAATKAYVDNLAGGEFSDSTFRIQDNGDATKELAFEVSGITTGTTRTWTVPDANITFGAYAPTLLNVADEAGFKAAVNLEIGTDVQAYSATLGTLAGASDASHLTDIAGLTLANGDIFYVSSGAITNLAKGTDGQVLSLASGAPAWANASTGGLVFITSTDLSGDATANFTGFDSGSYDAYLFVLQNVKPASDNVAMYVRTSTDSGSNYDSGASDYSYGYREIIATPSAQDIGSAGAAQIQIARNLGNQTGEDGLSGYVWVLGPHLASKTIIVFNTMYFNLAAASTVGTGAGARLSSADVDAIQFLFASGNLASGTITMYGLVNA